MKASLKNILKVLKVLYIDDKDNVPKNIQNTLKLFCKKIYYVSTIEYAIELYNHNKPDIIISEVSIQGDSCLPLLHNIREYNHFIPIIITSSNKEEKILFDAIRLHLVDFLVKPLNLEDFIHTLNNTAKFVLQHGNVIIIFNNNFSYNYIEKTVKIDEKIIYLTKHEAKLLELLLANEGHLITKEDIEFHLWGEEFVSDSAFKSLLKRIRDKIGKDTIKNTPGFGYHLN